RPVALFYAMMQQWKIAPKYAYSFLAALRMLPLMLEEFQTLRYALKVRGKKKRNPITGWYTTLRMYAIPLLAQSIRRAHRTAVAMEAKRFSSAKKRTYYYVSSYSILDVYYIFYWIALVILANWLGKAWPLLNAADVR
ncbi:energy-coupling factor transporter transmembrane component T, partial [Paenibacillus sp. TAF58]